MKKIFLLISFLICLLLSAAIFSWAGEEADTETTPTPEPTAETAVATPAPDCDALIRQGVELMEKGKKKIGKAMIYADPEMKKKGEEMFAQGKALLEQARTLGPVCAAKVDKVTKKKKGASKGSDDRSTEPKSYY